MISFAKLITFDAPFTLMLRPCFTGIAKILVRLIENDIDIVKHEVRVLHRQNNIESKRISSVRFSIFAKSLH